MIQITDIEDSRVEEFRSLKGKNLLRDNLIVVEGEKGVLKLLKSTLKIKKIFAPIAFFNKYEDLLKGDAYFADRVILEGIVGHHLHQGIMALAERAPDKKLSDLLFPALILNGVSSPENVGSIVRSCAAFGIKSLIVDPKSCSPYLRRCIRVSMGNIFFMDIHHSKDLKETIAQLKASHVEIYGAANVAGSLDLPDLKFWPNTAIILGSEGHGIESDILDMCEKLVRIPIDGDVAHLNVATATSIFLYKLNQDLFKSSH